MNPSIRVYFFQLGPLRNHLIPAVVEVQNRVFEHACDEVLLLTLVAIEGPLLKTSLRTFIHFRCQLLGLLAHNLKRLPISVLLIDHLLSDDVRLESRLFDCRALLSRNVKLVDVSREVLASI